MREIDTSRLWASGQLRSQGPRVPGKEVGFWSVLFACVASVRDFKVTATDGVSLTAVQRRNPWVPKASHAQLYIHSVVTP